MRDIELSHYIFKEEQKMYRVRRRRMSIFGRKDKLADEIESLKTDLQEVKAMLESIEQSSDADWFKSAKLVLAKRSSERSLNRIDKIKTLL